MLFRSELTLEKAQSAIEQGTRQYAKRQVTWFRKEAGVHWLAGFGDDPATQRDALAWLQQQGLIAGRGTEPRSV